MNSDTDLERSALAHYLEILWRRKLLVIVGLIIVPVVALAITLRQTAVYASTDNVLLNRQNLVDVVSGAQASNNSQPGDLSRDATTQSDLAMSPDVAALALSKAGLSGVETPTQLLTAASVTPDANADLLYFKVEDPSPSRASQLAASFAAAYVAYRQQLDTTSLRLAEQEVATRIAELGSSRSSSGLYSSLVAKQQELLTLQVLQTSNATVVPTLLTATKVRPKPVLDAVLGAVLGLVLGLAAAFAAEGLDTRLRTVDQVEQLLGARVIGSIPRLPRRLADGGLPFMITAPRGQPAEAFRLLRATLSLSLPSKPVSLMVTSPEPGDGKSTIASNLAVALASGGKRVVLVDADLRWPQLARIFDLPPSPGLLDVALERATLRSVLHQIDFAEAAAPNGRPDSADGANRRPNSASPWLGEGSLHVLPAGQVPPGLGDFFTLDHAKRIAGLLLGGADIVIYDAPPILHVNDAIALGSIVDYQLFVIKLQKLRRGTVKALRRAAELSPARSLGFVLNRTDTITSYAYAYGYRSGPVERLVTASAE